MVILLKLCRGLALGKFLSESLEDFLVRLPTLDTIEVSSDKDENDEDGVQKTRLHAD